MRSSVGYPRGNFARWLLTGGLPSPPLTEVSGNDVKDNFEY